MSTATLSTLRLGRLLILAGAAAIAIHAREMPAGEDGDGPVCAWRVEGGDANFTLLRHDCSRDQVHSGLWAECISIAASPGESVYASQAVPHQRLIAETRATVWVKASRPGLQLLGRVVLPRSREAESDKPVTVLVRGSGYTQTGAWQQLQLDDLPRRIERQARVARVQLGRSIDTREAYLEAVLVNIYGGAGTTDAVIDGLEISGGVALDAVAIDGQVQLAAANEPLGPALSADPAADRRSRSPDGEPSLPATGALPRNARIAGDQLHIDDRPVFPRMVEHRGEPLALLKSLGFNMVRLDALPTPQLLSDARSAGIWLVSPPPREHELDRIRQVDATSPSGRAWDAVVAWDFSAALRSEEFDAVRQWAKAMRAADPVRRPLLGDCEEGLRTLSRYVDVVFPARLPLGSSLSLSDYGLWLSQRQRLARPGTPFWTTIQTELTDPWQQQAITLVGQRPAALAQDDQVRQLVFTALAAGARGLSFQGVTPLHAEGATARRRATILEWINLELGLIEPWATHGTFLTKATGSEPNLSALVLQTPQARLVAPVSQSAGSQIVADAGTSSGASLIVPGGQAADQAFELTPAALRPLSRQRVAGGLRITLSDGDRASLIVLTQNASVVSELTKRIAKTRPRAAELERQLALQQFAAVDGVLRRLPAPLRQGKEVDADLAQARSALAECDARLGRRDTPAALTSARHARQALRRVERTVWERFELPHNSVVAAPLAASFGTLHEQVRLLEQWRVAPQGQNLLAGGDMESLELMRRAGWQNLQFADRQLQPLVELSPDQPREGLHSLHLQARLLDPSSAPPTVEAPPILVRSPGVPVELGQVYFIHGWVKVEQPLAGSVDGLTLSDSLGGDALAERFAPAAGWREFGLFRVAPRRGELVLQFALTGVGEAWLDHVQVCALGPAQLANHRP